MGRRELETEGREYAKAGKEFRFAPFLPTPPQNPKTMAGAIVHRKKNVVRQVRLKT